MSNNAVIRYRAERSGTVYYTLGVLVLLFGFGMCFHACYSLVSDGDHPDYVNSPSCDEKLLLDGAEHLSFPCAVYNAKILRVMTDYYGFDPLSGKLRIEGTLVPERDLAGTINDWTEVADGERVRAQLYKEGTRYYISRVYDVKDKLVRVTKAGPKTRRENAGIELKIGLISIGIAALWIFLGQFAKFAE